MHHRSLTGSTVCTQYSILSFPKWGGDSDTIACITGGIAEAFYKEIPMNIIESVIQVLPVDILELIDKFSQKFR